MTIFLFLGCKIDDNTITTEGMDSLVIPKAEYVKLISKGIMPDCEATAWRDIVAGN
jgi:predicted transcriptional regulator YdeE